MNVEVVDGALEEISRTRHLHSQKKFASRTDCGTTMCLAGWIAVRGGYLLDLRSGETSTAACVGVDGARRRIFDVASAVAGLHSTDAYELFISSASDSYEELVLRWKNMSAPYRAGAQ